MKYNVLVLGSGGREHALCWKLSQSPLLGNLFCLPGNAGISELATISNEPDILDFPAIETFCKKNNIHLIAVGKELPLVNGIKDFFADTDILVFGPSKHAAMLEGSKIYTKNLLSKYNIPTAGYHTFFNKDDALYYSESIETFPCVIKADGLAQGKGVVIANNKQEVISSILEMMEHKKFQQAGEKIVIEDFLEGRELSFQILVNNDQYFDLLPSQDYKKAYDGNKGPNTGGMGNIAPAPWVTPIIRQNIRSRVIEPLMHALHSENNPYTGIMFIGLMIDALNNPYVLEINARFGDPESQVVMPLLKTDLLPAMLHIAKHEKLPTDFQLEWKDNVHATCVVLTSKGYPIAYEKGKEITGLSSLNEKTDCLCFHAGTTKIDTQYVTSGGRVLNIVALGSSQEESRKKAYEYADTIDFEGKTIRTDIGL